MRTPGLVAVDVAIGLGDGIEEESAVQKRQGGTHRGENRKGHDERESEREEETTMVGYEEEIQAATPPPPATQQQSCH